MTVVAAIGAYWFEVPIRGNLALLYLATALYLMTTLGIGLLISTVSQTQQQAMMGTFFFFFPAMLLSGFTFPIANMPNWVQWITCLDPLRYYLAVIRVFFSGDWARHPLAATGGVGPDGRFDPLAGDKAVSQDAGMSEEAAAEQILGTHKGGRTKETSLILMGW